jgi:hypothetical protein
MRATASHFPLPPGSSSPRKLGGLPATGGVLVGSGNGSMVRTIGSWSLRGGSSGAPAEERWWGVAEATSPLRRVAGCGVGDSFDGVWAPCAEASAASMAMVQRVPGIMVDHLGGVARCGGFAWRLPRWKARDTRHRRHLFRVRHLSQSLCVVVEDD